MTLNLDKPINNDSLPPGCRKTPDGMVELPRFFILDEHEFTDEKTGEKVKLNRERLEEIARRINTRRKRTGDLVPICPGHTVDGAPETKQPEIVGYAVDASVEPFFDTGKYAISVTPIAKSEDHVRYFKLLPRRSVELWLNPDDIDPIALLGSTTPRRDLGLHRFNRDSSSSYHYELSEPQTVNETNPSVPTPPPVPPAGNGPQVSPDILNDLVPKVLEALMQTPLMMSLADALNNGGLNASEPDGDEGDDDILDGGDEDFDGEDLEDFDDESRGDEPDEKTEELPEEEEEEEEEDLPVKNSAHASSGNSYVPGYDKKKMSRSSVVDQYLARYERDRQESLERKTLVKLQREKEDLEKRIVALEEEKKIGEVTKLLSQLDDLGIEYDLKKETSRLIKMSKKDQVEHVNYIKKIASSGLKQKLPNGGEIPVKQEELSQVKMQKAGEIQSTEPSDPEAPKSFEQVSELAEKKVKQKFSKKAPTAEEVLAATGLTKVR